MIVTSDERRNVLKLFNVSEAARHLGIAVQKIHRHIRAGRLPEPHLRIGKRSYYTSVDLNDLSTKYKNEVKPI